VLIDLKKSGLTETDARKLKIKYLSEKQTNDHLPKQLQNTGIDSYSIPYFDIDGKETEFKRIRYLVAKNKFEELTSKFVPEEKRGDLKPKGKSQKYTQEKDSGVHLYLPPYENWRELIEDPEKTFYITEGEKKAAKACKEGFPTAGLGGVDSYRDGAGQSLFREFKLKGRKVVICYDSDGETNKNIRRAETRLCQVLIEDGAIVYTKRIPHTNNQKWGIDDFVVKFGKKKFEDIPEIPMPLTHALLELNKNFATLISTCELLDKRSSSHHQNFSGTASTLMEPALLSVVDEKGNNINVPSIWNSWPAKSTYYRVAYEPGRGQVVESEESKEFLEYNIYRDSGVPSKKGSIKPFVDFINFLTSDNLSKTQLEWLWQWMGYPIKNMGEKMYSCVAIYSPTQGNGKSYLGDILGKIYGPTNYSEITQEDMEQIYNEMQAHKQFVMGDEISGTDKRKHNDKIKYMITRPRITVNIKYERTYSIKDCANYYFTANHPDAFYLEDADRRFFVVEGTKHSLERDNPELLKSLNKWIANGGIGCLRYHFEKIQSYVGFNPKGAAPDTDAKSSMTAQGRSDAERWAIELFENPDYNLNKLDSAGTRHWYLLKELMGIYELHEKSAGGRDINAKTLSNAMRRVGFSPARKISTYMGSKDLWLVRGRGKAKWKDPAKVKPALIRRDFDQKKIVPTQLKSVK